MDDNNNRSLDKYEFNKAMKDFGLGFSDSEIQTLFSYFDFDRSNAIEFVFVCNQEYPETLQLRALQYCN